MSERPRDAAGKFISSLDVERYRTITVWNQTNGDVVKVLYDATERQLQEIEKQYDEPWHDIQVEMA